jgi:hypothetical protein
MWREVNFMECGEDVGEDLHDGLPSCMDDIRAR